MREEPTSTSDNRRAAQLLAAALRHGLETEASTFVKDCWTIRGDNGHSITVYGGRNHSVTVMADLPGERDWIAITQRRAYHLMSSDALLLEATQQRRELERLTAMEAASGHDMDELPAAFTRLLIRAWGIQPGDVLHEWGDAQVLNVDVDQPGRANRAIRCGTSRGRVVAQINRLTLVTRPAQETPR